MNGKGNRARNTFNNRNVNNNTMFYFKKELRKNERTQRTQPRLCRGPRPLDQRYRSKNLILSWLYIDFIGSGCFLFLVLAVLYSSLFSIPGCFLL